MAQTWLRVTLASLGVLALAACSGVTAAAPPPVVPASSPAAVQITLPASPLMEEQKILHVLNRLGYGPRPGDVERVEGMGLAAYLQQQLYPEAIPDRAVEQKLKNLTTLTMTSAELMKEFPQPDPKLRQKIATGELSRAEMMEMFPPEKRPIRIIGELQSAKLIRAIESERQLEEVMVDFWFNHFNVFAGKGAVKWMLVSYERDAIRPHALGKFRDLVLATARHPAMLFYLDNWMSVKSDFPSRPGGKGPKGLNENYARELMELHTLGVDGGYTQKDVVEVARCFTGWTIDRPREGGGFVFRPLAHDNGEKVVLGHRIPAGGGKTDAESVIDILVRQPSTAKFIATKLARRFIADEPPPALADRVADTFTRTDGDIRAMLVTIITSAEFFAADTYRAKIKKPFELVASAVRAVGGTTSGSPALSRAVAQIGEPLYAFQPPTGYPDIAEAWVNTGALLNRMNFALGLTEGRFAGTRPDLGRLVAGADPRDPKALLDRLLAGLLHNQVTPDTRDVLLKQLSDPEILRATSDDRTLNPDVEKIAALVLGSPEFQRR
ncbi:MAG: DUF1800 domain-containing protein [Candidatus Rokuibacteriota bacterium]